MISLRTKGFAFAALTILAGNCLAVQPLKAKPDTNEKCQQAGSVSTGDPETDVARYVTALNEYPGAIVIRITRLAVDSVGKKADFTFTRFYKHEVAGRSRTSTDLVKGHLTYTYVIPANISTEDKKSAKPRLLVKDFETHVIETYE